MKRKILILAASVFAAALVGLAVWKSPGPHEKKPVEISCRNGEKVRFLPVEGTSRIPLDYFLKTHSPAAKSKRVPVAIPAFWIAEDMVTEGLFSDVMGRPVREGREREQPLSDIEWEEAFEFCRKFTELYAEVLPAGSFVSMPTNLEWAHAMERLERPSSFLNGPVGSFVFVGNPEGGFLQTLGSFLEDHPADEKEIDRAYDFANIGKRQKKSYCGLRLVLVDWAGGQVESQGKPVDNAHVSRGVVLLQHGLFEEAQAMLASALKNGNLSPTELKRAKNAIAHGKTHREYDIEDWGGLLRRAMDYADRRGFVVTSIAELWENSAILSEGAGQFEVPVYADAEIRGQWMKIGDLPASIRAEQSVGEKYELLVTKGSSLETRPYTISDDTRVQVLECDFSGDGKPDLVVEDFGNVGSNGYWYDFWESLPDGSYSHRESLQTVGLCVLPAKNGSGCGFVTVGKESNPVLVPSLLTFRDGKAIYESVGPKPIIMSDANGSTIYLHVPFIGAGNGMGWKLLEGGYGVFFRPLFWVWEPCHVQGLPETI